MFWSKLCKSTWNCAWHLAFAVFISPIVWNICENLHYESVYFKELVNEQEYYWPTIYRGGGGGGGDAAVMSTITSVILSSNEKYLFLAYSTLIVVLTWLHYVILCYPH